MNSTNPCATHQIDLELRRPFWRLRFAAGAEASFLSAAADRRARHNIVCLGALIVLYDMALLPDWLQSRDTFAVYLILRLAVFTPLCLLVMTLVWRGASEGFREGASAALMIASVALEAAKLLGKADVTAGLYQLGGGLCCMMFVSVVMQLRFRYTLLALLGMAGIKVAAVWAAPGSLDLIARATITHAVVSGFLMLLLANYLLERSERTGYLHAVRIGLLHDELQQAARTDGLTGLGNRRHLLEICGLLWAPGPDPQPISAILLDIDHFKRLNDHCGHIRGDVCLRLVADCLRDSLQPVPHHAFRFGGEEMLILLPGCGPTVARRRADALLKALRREAIPHPALGSDAHLTVSLGVATASPDDMSADSLIAAADGALYAAKRAGRDRVCCQAEAAMAA